MRKLYIPEALSISFMAENDIYNSKKQYETIVKKIESRVYLKPDKRTQYFVKNPDNLKYLRHLVKEFEFRDISYVRRIQFFKALRKTCFCTDKDLKALTREDAKEIVSKLNSIHHSPVTRRDFINYNKASWKIILPEKDQQGRVDDTIVPYTWRISAHSDKSLQRDKTDKLNNTEYIKIQNSLSADPRMQLYFALMYECLARPQELCYININDVDLRDDYARIRIKEHGKEGTKTLQVIESYYYLTQWLNKHPLKHDQEAPLFMTLGNKRRHERLSPKHANKILHSKLKELGINKPITNYSFKRNGVTVRLLAGESAQNIQKIAGWTSTDQLQTYDLSDQEDFFKEELIRKGIVKPNETQKRFITYRTCVYCNTINPPNFEVCAQCKRPLNREKIIAEEKEKEKEIQQLKAQIDHITDVLKALTNDRTIEALKKVN